jgi:hypothetical protein
MYKLKNSLVALIGLLLLIGLIATFTSNRTQGQGNSANGPPPLDVNVVNTPSVNVINDTTKPVPVRDVDNGQQPFQRRLTLTVDAGSAGSSGTIPVPSGKRWIIETVTARADLEPGDTPNRLEITTGFLIDLSISVSKQGVSLDGKEAYVGTHYMRAYANPASNVSVLFTRSNTTGGALAVIVISGYLVDVP